MHSLLSLSRSAPAICGLWAVQTNAFYLPLVDSSFSHLSILPAQAASGSFMVEALLHGGSKITFYLFLHFRHFLLCFRRILPYPRDFEQEKWEGRPDGMSDGCPCPTRVGHWYGQFSLFFYAYTGRFFFNVLGEVSLRKIMSLPPRKLKNFEN